MNEATGSWSGPGGKPVAIACLIAWLYGCSGQSNRTGAVRDLRDRGVSGPTVRAAPPSVSGALPPEAIRRVVLRHLGQVNHCYEQGLAINPALAGRVVVRFVIGGSGTVMASGVADSSISIPSVGECIADAVHLWPFPTPEDGGLVTVSYPFNLQAAGDAATSQASTPSDAEHISHDTARDAARSNSRAGSAEELSTRFLDALVRSDLNAMSRLLVNGSWMAEVCPPVAGSEGTQYGPDWEGDRDLASALPAGQVILREVGPCVVEHTIVPDPPEASGAFLSGRACATSYQRAMDVVAMARCRGDRIMAIRFRDVAIVDNVWAVRDNIAWGVCQSPTQLQTCRRICSNQGDENLCRRLLPLLPGVLRRAVTH
jgi:hypothetical protein